MQYPDDYPGINTWQPLMDLIDFCSDQTTDDATFYTGFDVFGKELRVSYKMGIVDVTDYDYLAEHYELTSYSQYLFDIVAEADKDVADGKIRDVCAAARHHDDIAFLFQLADGFPDRCTADAQILSKLDFHQTFPGLQDSLADGLPQGLTYDFPKRLIAVQFDWR